MECDTRSKKLKSIGSVQSSKTKNVSTNITRLKMMRSHKALGNSSNWNTFSLDACERDGIEVMSAAEKSTWILMPSSCSDPLSGLLSSLSSRIRPSIEAEVCKWYASKQTMSTLLVTVRHTIHSCPFLSLLLLHTRVSDSARVSEACTEVGTRVRKNGFVSRPKGLIDHMMYDTRDPRDGGDIYGSGSNLTENYSSRRTMNTFFLWAR